jgi:nucleotide-binding universal stress UspA family protein
LNEVAPARIRRVLVAVDHSLESRSALAAAAELAAVFEAPLRGLFLEEKKLLDLAAHPVSSEVSMASGRASDWDPALLRLQLRARAEQARRALRDLAEMRRIEWSFQVIEGEMERDVLEAAAEADLTTIGRGRWALELGERRSSTVGLLRRARRLTLIHKEGRLEALPPVVFYDGSHAARRALEIVERLPRRRGGAIQVLVAGSPTRSAAELRREVERWAGARELPIVVRSLASATSGDVARTLALYRRHLIVLPVGAPVLRGQAVRTVVKSSCSVLVVG